MGMDVDREYEILTKLVRDMFLKSLLETPEHSETT